MRIVSVPWDGAAVSLWPAAAEVSLGLENSPEWEEQVTKGYVGLIPYVRGKMEYCYFRICGRVVYNYFQRKKRAREWLHQNLCYAKSLQSCPTVWPHRRQPTRLPRPWNSPWIFQARTLEWVAISFSNAWKWKEKVKLLSHVRLLATPWTAAYQAPPSVGFSRQEYWSGVPLPSPTSELRRVITPRVAEGVVTREEALGLLRLWFDWWSPIALWVFFYSLSIIDNFGVHFSSFLKLLLFSCSVISDSATPWTAARQASLSFTISWSLLSLRPIESVKPSNHLNLCRPLLLLPSVFPCVRVFASELALCLRWPKYWSFSIDACLEFMAHEFLLSFNF